MNMAWITIYTTREKETPAVSTERENFEVRTLGKWNNEFPLYNESITELREYRWIFIEDIYQLKGCNDDIPSLQI